MSDQKLTDLSERLRLTRQEERMNTHREKCEGALERLCSDMAKREKNMRLIIFMWIANIAVMGALIRLL